MSYYSFINWVHTRFGTPENDSANATDGVSSPIPVSQDVGSLESWKVTWRKEGAKFGKATCGVACGLVTNFAVLPLMIAACAGGTPIGNAPNIMSAMAYNAGAWLGGHLGDYVGWGIGALAAETFDMVSKISSKLFQWAKTLFTAVMSKIGYPPNVGDGNNPEDGSLNLSNPSSPSISLESMDEQSIASQIEEKRDSDLLATGSRVPAVPAIKINSPTQTCRPFHHRGETLYQNSVGIIAV